MIQFRQSIGFRLLVISFILLAIPLLVDSFILVQKRYEHAISDAKEMLVEVAHFKELPLLELQPLDAPVVQLLIDYLGLEKSFPQEKSKTLDEKLEKLSQIGGFYGIFLLKITGDNRFIVIASGREEYIGRDYTNFFKMSDIYTKHSFEKGYSGYMTVDKDTLNPYFVMANPIYSTNENRFVGIIALTDDITAKIKTLLQPDMRNYKINFALLLPSSIVFAASDPTLRFQYFQPLDPAYKKLFLEEEPLAKTALPSEPLSTNTSIGAPFFEFTWNGQSQIGYVKNITGVNYSLLAYAAKNEIFQTPLIEFFNIYSIYGIILILGGAAATLLTMRMAKPIQNLGLVMTRIQEGDIQLRYQKDPFGFEINLLGEIFNGMVSAVLLQKRIAEKERVKKESFARELRLGQQVQRNLLPHKMPDYPGVEVAEIYIPTIEVSGDFYDVFLKDEKEDKKLVLAIADVSGKGVQACFYSLSVRTMLRTYAKEYSDIADAMLATNNLFRLDTGDTGLFVTVLCGVYDHRTKILSYYSCGHNPGYVRRADGSVEILVRDGMAMGVFAAEKSKARTIQLEKGDIVVFYTDGVTEAHNSEYQLFGEGRLVEYLSEKGDRTATEIVDGIVERVNAFVAQAAQHDDITLLVMKIIE